ILAVDAPMLEKAVNNYKKLGVVATNAPSGPATKAQLEKLANVLGKEIEVDTEINTQAMTELKAGNVAEHDRLNALAAAELKKRGSELIILAQITQASAEQEAGNLGLPVLTSPREIVKAVLEKIENRQSN